MSRGADTNAGAPREGTLEPEVAEQFASAFVPMWQFDEASFTAGTALSSEEVGTLAAGHGNQGSDPPASSVEDGESRGFRGTLPPPSDPFPREAEAEVSGVPFAAHEADPFLSLRDDDSSVRRRAAIGRAELAPVSNEGSPEVVLGGQDVLPTRANRRLVVVAASGVAIVASMVVTWSRSAPSPQRPLRSASAQEVQEAVAPQGPSIPPPPPVSDLVTSSAEMTAESSGPPTPEQASAPQSAKPPRSARELPSGPEQESSRPTRNPDRAQGATGASPTRSDRSPRRRRPTWTLGSERSGEPAA